MTQVRLHETGHSCMQDAQKLINHILSRLQSQ